MIHPIRRPDLFRLALVLVIAAAARFYHLGTSEYHYDHAVLSRMAQQMVETRTLATLGMITSVGVPNTPTSVYVVALAYIFTADPLLVNAFLIALNVAGVGVLWLLAHRYFRPSLGLAAGLLYALNPWAIFYSRGIWAQDFLTPFMLAGLVLGLLGFYEGKRWAQIACLPVLLFGAQIHYAAMTLLPLYLWFLWLGRQRLHWRGLLVSFGLGALVVLPFMVGFSQWAAQPEGAQTLKVLFGGGRPLDIHRQAIPFSAWLATGLGLEHVISPGGDLLARLAPPSWLWLIAGGMALLGLVVLWQKYGRLALLVTLWIALPVLFFLPTWMPVYTHYLIVIIPALALLAGLGFLALADLKPPVSQAAVTGVMSALLITQGVWWVNLVHYLETTATPPSWPSPEGFSVPMAYLLDVRQRVLPVRDVLLFSTMPQKNDSLIWEPLLYRQADCLREVVASEGGVAVFPAQPFAALTAPGGNPYPLPDLYQTPTQTTVPLRPGEGEYTIALFEAAPAWTGTPLLDVAPARFDNGVALTGYALEAGRLYLQWELPAPQPQAAPEFFFAHFLNANGERLGQRDANFWPSKYWCAGDRLVQWVDTNVPTETVTLRVGLYRTLDGSYLNRNVTDAAGNSLGQWVDTPLPKPD